MCVWGGELVSSKCLDLSLLCIAPRQQNAGARANAGRFVTDTYLLLLSQSVPFLTRTGSSPSLHLEPLP